MTKIPHRPIMKGTDADASFVDRFQILALSGGGYRGLFTAALLVKLEEENGPLKNHFDLITGTSIGSILAGALSIGVSASDCLQGMLDHGESIFPTTGRIGSIGRSAQQAVIKAPYKTEPLIEAITEILGTSTSASLSSIAHPLAIPCVSHTRAELKVMRSKGLAGSDADTVTLIEAMLASAAAPTYFPSQKIQTEVVVDGGLIANAPEMIGITDAVRLKGIPLSNIHVLSIGTASTPLDRPPEDTDAASIAGWMVARELFQVTMQAQERMAQSHCEMLIGERYLRLDRTPAPEQAKVLGLDRADTTAAETLIDLAKKCWDDRKDKVKKQLSALLRHNS